MNIFSCQNILQHHWQMVAYISIVWDILFTEFPIDEHLGFKLFTIISDAAAIVVHIHDDFF